MTQATLNNIQHGTRLVHKKTGVEARAYYPRQYGTGRDQQTHEQITIQSVKDGVVQARRVSAKVCNYWVKD